MNRQITFLIFIVIISIILNSGCIENTKANQTWGEKNISLAAINISNDTLGTHNEINNSIYYVSGHITNQNSIEVLKMKIKIITYYSNGTIFAVNDTPYLEPKNIPANGKSYFYARFDDPDNKIDRFEVKILDASAEYV